MIDKERIVEIFEKSGVLTKGHFLYTSGLHGKNYMQCAKVLQYPKYTEEIIKSMAEEFKNDNIEIVVGPAMGGVTISYEFARQLNALSYFAERENNIMTLRRGFEISKGAKVLVVEDVITTGGSVREVIDLVENLGGEVVGVATLVDRSGGEIQFGKKLVTAYSEKMVAYNPDKCPLCREGKLPLVKPGSRKIL